nr:SLC13 family permease [Evansella caseinilytica]
MSLELLLTFCILIVTTAVFVWGKIRSDLVALLSMLALVFTGIITTEEALSGFSNSLVIMIAGLFVVGAGIFRTGLAEAIGKIVIQWAKGSELKLLILVMLVVAFLSAFMSNTGTVAVLMPVIITVAVKMKTSPSKYLIPLAYASSLGGVLTLIGTPPNLIASQTLADYGYERLTFFDFTPLGLIALLTGIVFLAVFNKFLIPNKAITSPANDNGVSPSQLIKMYSLADHCFKVSVGEGALLTEKKLKDLQLPKKFGIHVLFIERTSDGARHKKQQLSVTANTVFKKQDVLYVEGENAALNDFVSSYHLELLKREELLEKRFLTSERGIVEVLFTPYSRFLNLKIKDLHFRENYGLNIIGMNRKGKYLINPCADDKVEFGDAVLVQGQWENIELLSQEIREVVVVGKTNELASQAKANGRAPIAGAIMLAMLLMMTLEIFPPVTAVILSAIAMVMTGCLRNMDDAYSRINWESVVLIGAMLPMASALEKTGGITLLSNLFIQSLGSLGPLAVMAGFYFSTMLFSQFISNTATAVLFAPIAVTSALQMGVSPYPFLIAVSVAASMAFATPVASPTNALVMTAGGYTFFDFVKIGIPLQIVLFIVMIFFIPVFFPF